MRKLLVLSKWLMLSIIFVACGGSTPSLNSYVDSSFDLTSIKRLAIFPISNSDFAHSEIRTVDEIITSSILSRNPDIEVKSTYTTVILLEAYNLDGLWLDFLDEYKDSGLLNKNKLASFGESLEIDAILYGEIKVLHQVDGRDVLFALDGVHGGNIATTKVAVKYRMLSTKNGNLVWESSCNGIKETIEAEVSAPPVIDAVYSAVDNIFSNLPK